VGASAAADAEDGFGLIDEEEGELAFGGAFAALGEEVADLSFGFADPHVEDFGAFDVDEELGVIDAGGGAELVAEVEGGGFAEEGFAAARGTVEEEALGDGVVEAFEEVAVEEGEFDGVADGLDGVVLAADGGPGQFGDPFEGAVDAAGAAEDFEGDALVEVEADFEAGLEFFLGEEGGAEDDGGVAGGFGAEAESVIGEDLVDGDDGAVGVEAEVLDDGEGFVAEDAGADVEVGDGDSGVDLADVIGAADADVGAVGFDGAEEGAGAEGWGAEFFDDFLVAFEGGAGLVVHFLEAGDAVAEVGQFEEG
jgi:hypothetical protein